MSLTRSLGLLCSPNANLVPDVSLRLRLLSLTFGERAPSCALHFPDELSHPGKPRPDGPQAVWLLRAGRLTGSLPSPLHLAKTAPVGSVRGDGHCPA